jgi:hypothetical protein
MPEKDDNDIVISGDGPNTWASRGDLAEATAAAVANWVSQRSKTKSVLEIRAQRE